MQNPAYGYDQGAPAAQTDQGNLYANQNEEKQTPPDFNNIDPAYSAQTNPPYPTQQNPGYPTQQPVAYPGQQTGPYPAQQPYTGAPTANANYVGAYTAQPGTVGYSAGANTVVITQPGAYGYGPHASGYVDNTGAIVFSCVVSWCCCCICGIAAFVFALLAGTARTTSDATRKLLISTRLSIGGLVAGIVTWLFFLILLIVAAAT